MKSKIIRVDTELADELKYLANKNNMKQIDITKELARMLKNQKVKISREIIF